MESVKIKVYDDVRFDPEGLQCHVVDLRQDYIIVELRGTPDQLRDFINRHKYQTVR